MLLKNEFAGSIIIAIKYDDWRPAVAKYYILSRFTINIIRNIMLF